jgi:hypothetical protein
VTTDGFLLPNAVLEQRGLMRRKGFPESYDTKRLLDFVSRLKAGRRSLAVPTYSHQTYDIVPDGCQTVDRPDILILEGLNVLQGGEGQVAKAARLFVSDFFDFSLYVDAAEDQLESWYLERFARLRETAFNDPRAYFRFYAEMPNATSTWKTCARTSPQPAAAPTWCCAKAGTIRSMRSGSGRADRSRLQSGFTGAGFISGGFRTIFTTGYVSGGSPRSNAPSAILTKPQRA